MNTLAKQDRWLLIGFTLALLAGPILLKPFGAGYPDLLQKFCIFGIFAVGYNILFGLTGYLSFGHEAFLGIGPYTPVWGEELPGPCTRLSSRPITASAWTFWSCLLWWW